MSKNTITIAGETLEELEAALDCYDITFEECGCVNMSGRLPEHLSQVLARALRTVEAEISESDGLSIGDWGADPMRQLFMRIGSAYVDRE